MNPKTDDKNPLELSPFDVGEHPDSEEMIAEYLAEALEDPDPNIFLKAVFNVAKAKGVAKVAEKAGIRRESLYQSLRSGTRPRLETVQKLMKAFGVKLNVVSAS